MQRSLLRLFDPLLNLVYPRSCAICGSSVEHHENGPACIDCWEAKGVDSGPDVLCPKCGAVEVVGRHADQNADCPECRGLHFDRAYAAGPHTGALRAVVIAMKTMPTVPLRALDEIRSCLERSPAGRYDAILPVPLAPRREFDRGFNQAEVLAKYVGEMLGVDVDRSSLGREKYVPINRAGMDRKARVATVEKAFKVVRPRLVEGRRILLVDDVMTTGSTASACAEALKRKGAAHVDVFTITRAASHGHFND